MFKYFYFLESNSHLLLTTQYTVCGVRRHETTLATHEDD